MSEYLVQRQSLENIADEIRVLSGTTGPLGLDEMATNVSDANDELAAQAIQIEEIMELLEGKSVPGGSGVETCNVRLHGNQYAYAYWYACPVLKSDGTIEIASVQVNNFDGENNFDFTIENVICGSMLAVRLGYPYGLDDHVTEGATAPVPEPVNYSVYFSIITAAAGETATIYCEGSD